jgi:hypothetical protein
MDFVIDAGGKRMPIDLKSTARLRCSDFARLRIPPVLLARDPTL